MGAYDITSQLYQQGLERGMDRQFALATQAQPVSNFLSSLRSKTEMDQKQQALDTQEEYRQAQQQHMDATEALNLTKQFDTLGTPENVGAYRGLAEKFGHPEVIPADREETDAQGFTRLIKPTGSLYRQNQDKLEAQSAARRSVQTVKMQIAQMADDTKRRNQDLRNDPNSLQGQQTVAHTHAYQAAAELRNKELEKIEAELNSGLIDAKAAHERSSAALNGARRDFEQIHAGTYGQVTPHDAAMINAANARNPFSMQQRPVQPGVTIKFEQGPGGGFTPKVEPATPGAPAVDPRDPFKGTLKKETLGLNPRRKQAVWADAGPQGPGWYEKQPNGTPKKVE